ncbi:NADPH-dependent F420 reductase (plasmid) [Rhodococcus erythropolis]|uniref:NADPH-dependent F420 reductase n=1 Tax=Rhodococcus erythropolis TaxID=1833 RepID=UPI00406BA6BF
MKVGIIGTGNIGATLAQKLSAAGHEVKVANSRGPTTIAAQVLSTGATPVDAHQAVVGVDVLILSIPLNRIPEIAHLVAAASADTVVVETSNYYPRRDSKIDAIENGQVESEWVSEQLRRPIIKAWNAIGSSSFARKGSPTGASGRIAIPVAGDSDHDRALAMRLVDDTGFDGFDAGILAASWRQQPGTPCYTTDLSTAEMSTSLASAEASRSPKRRDLAVAAIAERMGDNATNPDADYNLRLCRALFM